MSDILEFIDKEQVGLDRLKMHSNNLNLFFKDLVWEIVDDVLFDMVKRNLDKYFLHYNEHPEILIDYNIGYFEFKIIFDYGKLEFSLGRRNERIN